MLIDQPLVRRTRQKQSMGRDHRGQESKEQGARSTEPKAEESAWSREPGARSLLSRYSLNPKFAFRNPQSEIFLALTPSPFALGSLAPLCSKLPALLLPAPKLPASRQRLQQTNIMLFKWLDAFNLQLTPMVKALGIFYISPGHFVKQEHEKISLLIR
jgi:hypothetical protein